MVPNGEPIAVPRSQAGNERFQSARVMCEPAQLVLPLDHLPS